MYNKFLMQIIATIIIFFTGNAMEFQANLAMPGQYYVTDISVVSPVKNSMAVKAHIDHKNVIVLYGDKDYKKALIVLYQYPVDVDYTDIDGVHNTFGCFNPDKMSTLYEKCLMLCQITPEHNAEKSLVSSISSLQAYIKEANATDAPHPVTIKITIPGKYDCTVVLANIIGLIQSNEESRGVI